jgi:hypothetical protein
VGHAAEHALVTVGLVVEDAPSGLVAGRAAGARTLAVCTSHTREKIVASGVTPDFIVNDLTRYEIKMVGPLPPRHVNRTLFRVSARWVNDKVVVEIDESL